MNQPIRSMDELVQAIRQRKDELNLSNETIDGIAGFQSGYCSKLLAPKPLRNIGYMSLGSLMGALGVGLVVVEDGESARLVKGRWSERKRGNLPADRMAQEMQDKPATVEELVKNAMRARMREIGMKGNKSSKRQTKIMKRRARQRAASHAARMRWSKRK